MVKNVKNKVNSLKKNEKIEGTFAIIAAFVVLFIAMLDSILSAVIASVLLVIYGAYKLMRKRK